jgi:hypothetical protein
LAAAVGRRHQVEPVGQLARVELEAMVPRAAAVQATARLHIQLQESLEIYILVLTGLMDLQQV